MWPKLWWVNFPDKFDTLTPLLKDDYIETVAYTTGKRAGESVVRPYRVLPGLESTQDEINESAIPPYTEDEISLYIPHQLQ